MTEYAKALQDREKYIADLRINELDNKLSMLDRLTKYDERLSSYQSEREQPRQINYSSPFL